jgi:acetylglutamate kinase
MLRIVKIGGNVIEVEKELSKFLSLFAAISGPKILVHGGGKKASNLLPKLGITPHMHNGRRITDEATLEVVTMVYAGLVNKKLVAQLQSLGVNAIGMSGADANSILAHKRVVTDIDYGYAGDVDKVDGKMLTALIDLGLTPVFCALTHDKKGQLLNTNADTIAATIAEGMSPYMDVELNYCFELPGVLKNINDPESLIPKIDSDSYKVLQEDGIIATGMLPKMKNCFEALKGGVKIVKIGNLNMLEPNVELFTEIIL